MLLSGASPADFWTATKLRGGVEQQVDGQWQPLARADVVPDDRGIRTLSDGHVEFQRGQETIDLGPGTQIQIHDRPGQQYTIVDEAVGTVTVEADVRNVNHFEVDTPFLAAVVKGTIFEVVSGKISASVSVSRGRVAVSDDAHHHAIVSAGQTASRGSGKDIVVSGTATDEASTGTEDQPDASSSSQDDHGSASDDDNGNGNSGKDAGNEDNGNSGDNGQGNGGDDNGNHGDGNNGKHKGQDKNG
jgi:hypothetical protein